MVLLHYIYVLHYVCDGASEYYRHLCYFTISLIISRGKSLFNSKTVSTHNDTVAQWGKTISTVKWNAINQTLYWICAAFWNVLASTNELGGHLKWYTPCFTCTLLYTARIFDLEKKNTSEARLPSDLFFEPVLPFNFIPTVVWSAYYDSCENQATKYFNL